MKSLTLMLLLFFFISPDEAIKNDENSQVKFIEKCRDDEYASNLALLSGSKNRGIYISVFGYDRNSTSHYKEMRQYAVEIIEKESSSLNSNSTYNVYFIDGNYSGNCDISNYDLDDYDTLLYLTGQGKGDCASVMTGVKITRDIEFKICK